VTGGKDLQPAIGFNPFTELLTPFYTNDPVKPAVQDTDGKLTPQNDAPDNRKAGTELP
jgi:hypothetical protein